MKENSITIGPYINWVGAQYIPAHNISYLEFGDPLNKNIVVCAHGLTRNAHDFDKIAQELSKDFRVIALSYPGRGNSENFTEKKYYNYHVYVKDSLIFLKKLNIKRLIWLGTSMGGIIGMVLACKYKELFKAMIINDVGPFISAAPLIKIGKYAGKTILFEDFNGAKEHLKLIYSQFGIEDEEGWDNLTKYSFVRTLGGKYKMNYDPSIAQAMQVNEDNPKDVNMWSIWNKIMCKLLVIHGAKSEILTNSTIEKMRETKEFDLYIVNNAGHAPALISQDQINYVKTWINEFKDTV